MRLIRDGDSTPPYRSTTYVRNGREAAVVAARLSREQAIETARAPPRVPETTTPTTEDEPT